MHRPDPNDLAHAARLGLDVVAALPCPLDETGRINPQVTRFALRDGRFADVVHVKPVYYQHANGAWRPLSEVCSHHGNRRIAIRPDRVSWVHPRYLLWLMKRQRLFGEELTFWSPGYSGVSPADLAFAATLTAYPDPDPETTTTDGYAGNTNRGFVSSATYHDAADGDHASATADLLTGVHVTAGGAYRIYRSFALFSTAALTSGATVTAGVFSAYCKSAFDADNDGDDWINAVQTSPASNTNIVAADFDQCGAVSNPTEGSTRIDITGMSTSVYADWTLDATGRGWISQTGVTKLGLREGHDALNHAPNVTTITRADFASADTAGTSSDPKLVVTYTPPPAGLLGDPLRAFQHMIMR